MSGRRTTPPPPATPLPAGPDDDEDEGDEAGSGGDGPESLRLDKWLWQARFFKTRSLAAKLCAAGGVAVEGHGGGAAKAHALLRPGMVLRFAQGGRIRVVRVEATGTRRGPAPEAQALYTDLSPPPPRPAEPEARAAGSRDPGAGRPTKRDRRAIARLQGEGEG